MKRFFSVFFIISYILLSSGEIFAQEEITPEERAILKQLIQNVTAEEIPPKEEDVTPMEFSNTITDTGGDTGEDTGFIDISDTPPLPSENNIFWGEDTPGGNQSGNTESGNNTTWNTETGATASLKNNTGENIVVLDIENGIRDTINQNSTGSNESISGSNESIGSGYIENEIHREEIGYNPETFPESVRERVQSGFLDGSITIDDIPIESQYTMAALLSPEIRTYITQREAIIDNQFSPFLGFFLGDATATEYRDALHTYERSREKNITDAGVGMIVARMTSPIQAIQNISSIIFHIILSLLYLLLFLFCASVLNQIITERTEKLQTGRIQHIYTLQHHPVRYGCILCCSIIGVGIIIAILQVFGTPIMYVSRRLVGFLVGTLILGAIAKDIVLYILLKRIHGEQVGLYVAPIGYIPLTLSAILNKIVGLTPNVLFGSIFHIRHRKDPDRDMVQGPVLLYTMYILLSIAIGVRFFSASFQGFVYVFFMGIVYGLLNDMFWSLTRLDVFWGNKIYAYSKQGRFFLYMIVLFLFFHLLLNPGGDFAQVQEGFSQNLRKMLLILATIIITTLIIRAIHTYGKWRHRQKNLV